MAGCPSPHQPTRNREETLESGNLFTESSAVVEFPPLYQVSSISKSCFFHVCVFCHIRAALTQEMANSVAVSLVTSRLDYANLFGISQVNLNKLQRIQNTLAKLVDPDHTHSSDAHSKPYTGSLLGNASTLKSPHSHLSFYSTALLPT